MTKPTPTLAQLSHEVDAFLRAMEPALPFGRATTDDRRAAISTIARRHGLDPKKLRKAMTEQRKGK